MSLAGAARAEAERWASLALLVRRRRHAVPPGAVAIPYDAAQRPTGLLMVGLCAVELVVVELVLPWHSVRLVLLVLGVWSLLFVLGMVAADVVRPHVVTADHLRLRSGTRGDALVPLGSIASAAVRRRYAPAAEAIAVEGDVLVMGLGGTTDVEVQLAGRTVVQTGAGPVVVRTLRFAADDPQAAVRALSGGR